jgi:thymidine kinase
MYSGKSSELFRQMERYLYAKKNIVLIRPAGDERNYITHSGIELQNNFKYDVLRLSKYDDLYEENLNLLLKTQYDAVFVDEYFMIKDAYKIAEHFGSSFDIMYAGLLASYKCELFDETIKLLPYCDNIVKLNGVCMECGSQLGNYSFYLGDRKESIIVGDTEYKVLCKDCYDTFSRRK